MRGNAVVGFIVFVLITVVQMLVITRVQNVLPS